MKEAAAMLALIMVVGNPFPAFCGSAGAESWQLFTVAQGGAAYAFAPAEIIRSGDRVQVRVRSVEATAAGKERVTAILYDLDCRQRTFRMLEVAEEQEGSLSVCKIPSDDIAIRPGKHPHLEELRARVCP